jgi:hypothetical protein
MASYIKIKRSTGTAAPASLQYGELAYTAGVGTHGNNGGRLFIGDNVPNPVSIGGRYYTDLLSIAPGKVSGQANPTTVANGFVAILDENRKVDQWNVDNITIDGNTVSSTNVDGNIIFDPNGAGDVTITGGSNQVFSINDGTTDRFVVDTTNGSLDVTQGSLSANEPVINATSTWNNSGITFNGLFLNVINTASAANSKLIDLQVGGATKFSVSPAGVGTFASDVHLIGDLYVYGGDIITDKTSFNLLNTTVLNANVLGDAQNILLGASSGVTTIRNSVVDLDGDLNVDGGDITSNQSSFNLLSNGPTTINFGTNATTLGIGSVANTTTVTINGTTGSTDKDTGALVVQGGVGIEQNLNIGGDLNVNGGDITSAGPSFNLLNTNVTSANVLNAGVNIVLGASTGITTIRNTVVDLDGDLNIDGGDVTTNQSSFNLLNQNALTINAFTAATAIGIGSTVGTSTINHQTQSTDKNTGALVVEGGAGIEKNLNVGGSLNVTGGTTIGGNLGITGDLQVDGNTILGNSATDQITITGNINQTGITTITGLFYADSVGINSNTIFTRSGSGNVLYLDPYPDGLSNEGTVVVKGDLQVDGTTTTVNSVTVTSNNPIYIVGDNATTRTVISAGAAGTTLLNIDSVAGIQTNDVVTGTNIPSNTVISNFDAISKVITISNSASGTIDAGTQLVITQGVDTNDDRGIGFKYVSSGVGTAAQVKTGFFGYDDSTGRWTYVPDASIVGNVVTGTKGFLDINGIFLQNTNTNGIAYFDSNGQIQSTASPAVGFANTSNYILTTNANDVPVWTDTIDGGLF